MLTILFSQFHCGGWCGGEWWVGFGVVLRLVLGCDNSCQSNLPVIQNIHKEISLVLLTDIPKVKKRLKFNQSVLTMIGFSKHSIPITESSDPNFSSTIQYLL